MNPQQLTTSLSNLVAWFPTHDPFELLQQNPQILENPNVEADPTYGEWGEGAWRDQGVAGCSMLPLWPACCVCAFAHGSLAD